MADTAPSPLLRVEDLRVAFELREGTAPAVDGVDLVLRPGETLALVGESGCGKSVCALALLGLVPAPGRIVGGRVLLDGHDLVRAAPDELRAVRGNELAMIFQEPMTALNPVFTLGEQIAEVVRLHRGVDRAAARARAVEMLARVGIPDPERRVDEYPHQQSGGMLQRVMIAMAMSCEPRLLIADEPTTALDVTVQAQILGVLADLQRSEGTGVLLITHDLGVVAEIADRVAVMYAGRIVEQAGVEELFAAPRHPYTRALFRSRPDLARPGERLAPIEGSVPNPLAFPSGCRFRTRCPLARERCAAEVPPLERLQGADGGADGEHRVACFYSDEVAP